MRKLLASSAALAVVVTLLPAAAPAAYADATTIFNGLQTGLGSVGTWAGDLANHGSLAEPIPLTSLSPGDDDLLDLEEALADAAGPWQTAVAAATDLPTLTSELEDIATDTAGAMTVTVGGFSETGGVTTSTFEIGIEVHNADVPLEVVDPDSGVGVTSTGTDGVPLTVDFTFDFTASFDDLTGEFWIHADPSLSYDAFIDADVDGSPDPFHFDDATFESVVGITQVEVLDPGSSLSLDVHADLAVVDSDGNGRLAFSEIAADDTLNDIGELTLPKSENVAITHTIEDATGTLLLSLPTGITVLGSGAPAIDVSLAGQVITVATNTDFDSGIAKFANIDTSELLGGLGQLSNMLEVVQRDPLADVDMPFVDLLLSQMLGTTDDVKRFVVEHTNVDDPATVLNEFGTATFATIQEFITAINEPGTGLSILPAGVVFDPATGYLDLPIALAHNDGGPVPLKALLFDEVDLSPEEVQIGRPALGDVLEDVLHITGLSAFKDVDNNGEFDTITVDGQTLLDLPAPTALVDRVLDVQIPWGVDLSPSVPCTDCDLDETLDFEEAETLPPYQRFYLRDLAGRPELQLDIASSMDASDLFGTAGFVDLSAGPGSLIELGKLDDTLHSLTLDLTFPPTLVNANGVTKVNSFVFHFAYDPTAPTPEMPADTFTASEFLTAANNLAADATLNLSALGIGDVIPFDLPGGPFDTIPVELTWPTLGSIADVQLADLEHTVTVDNITDPLVQALTELNFAFGEAIPSPDDALFATIIDHLAGLGASLEDVLEAGDLGEVLPFLAGTPGDLVDVFANLTSTADQLRNGALPDRLRDVLETIADQLGTAPALEFTDLGGDGVLDLIFDFDFSKTIDETLSINTGDLTGLPLAGVASADGKVQLAGSAAATLTVPVALELTTGALPAADVLIREDSGVAIDVSAVAGEDDEFSVSAFGQTLSLGPDGEFRLGFGGSLAYTPDPTGTDFVTLADFASNFGGSLGGTASDCVSHEPDDDVGDVPGGLACINMPVYFNGAPATGNAAPAPDDHWLQATWADFTTAPTLHHLPEDLAGAIGAELLSFGSFAEGLSRFIALLTDVLDGEVYGVQVPLIGDKLDGVADVLGDFQTVLDEFTSIAGLDGDLDAVSAINAAFDPVKTALDPLLLDGDGDSNKDFVVKGLCTSSEVDCTSSHTAAEIEAVEVAFALGQEAAGGLPFDLGLKGIDFVGVDGEVQAQADWQTQVAFGVSRTADFYLLDDPEALLYSGGEHGDELHVGASAGIAPGGIKAAFGILGFEATPRPDPDNEGALLPAEATIDLTGDLTGNGGKISIVDLATSNPLDTFDPSAQIGVDLNLDLTSLGDVAGTTVEGLPRVHADFDLEWSFTADKTGLSESTPLKIELGDPTFDVGAALSEMLGPIFGRIKNVVEVADDIRAFVFAPIPIISDLSRLFGGGDITFVDLAEIFGDVNLDFLEDVDKVLRFAALIVSIGAGEQVSFAELAGGAPGDFKVVFDADKALQDKPAPTQAVSGGLMSFTKGDGTTPATVGSMASALAGAIPGESADETDVTEDAEIFSMPMVDDPTCILGMLAGGDCIVLDWQPRELYLGAEVEIPFGPFFGILYINIGGFAGAGIKFGMGFSTRGIRRAIERGGFASDPAAGIGNLIVEGIFIHDFEGPELYVNAGIYAEGEVNVVIAAAGVRGGIEATLGFDLIDGPEIDGLVYLDEMATRIHNPLCLFEVVGFLEAFLQIYVEIGPCPFCVEEEFELARVRLLEFTARLAECDKDPVLATKDGDIIRLNIGTRAPQRETLGHIVDEQVTVREIVAPTGSSPGRFAVSAFGFTQEYEGKEIWFNAGDGDDVLLFQGSKAGPSPEEGEAPPSQNTGQQAKGTDEEAPFTAKVTGFGGAGNDAITTGDGNDVIYGGDDPGDGGDPAEAADNGKDQLTTGRGNDVVRGGPDADQIDTGLGADEAFGESGNDTINGGPGADTLLDGGSGNDRVDGGEHVVAEDGVTILFADGADRIAGGADDDYLWGGPGNDTILGDDNGDDGAPCGDGAAGGGLDVIHGELGDDVIYGGEGRDVVLGDETDAPLPGETYADQIWGQGDDDLLVGVWGNDEIHGCADDDVINGADGRDTLFGEGGDDRVFGDLWGELGAISIGEGGALASFPALTLPPVDLSFLETNVGTEDRDIIDGGEDDDVLNGDGDNDQIRGHEGDDLVNGGAGRDFIVGDDVVIDGSIGGAFGSWATDGTEDAAETLTGTFNDVIFGGPDADEIYGEGGDDHARGSAGADLIFGNQGEDDLFGDLGSDEVYGGAHDDDIQGGPDDDLLLGNEDTDTIYGQAGNDRIIGGSGFLRSSVTSDANDALYGGAGTDVILGDNGEVDEALEVVTLVPAAGGAPVGQFGGDTLVGDGAEDTLHGQDGTDFLFGGDADDQLFGELGGDFLLGQNGHDYLVGDRGRIGVGADGALTDDRLAHEAGAFWPSDVFATAGAPTWAVELQAANTAGGVDNLFGGLGDDHLYGGLENDTLMGGIGDDWMEGNAGRDTMHGLSSIESELTSYNPLFHDDQDVMLGGSSNVNPEADKHDDGEVVMHGDFAEDVMLGDNGNVDRLVESGEWAQDPVTGGHARSVELLDRERRDPADLDPVSGPDLMFGDGGNDRMYGEGGQDLVKGNADDDQLQGNQDRDVLEGNGGDDDLIGGTDLVWSGEDVGDPDDGDFLYGGADADVIAGDNAVITRLPVAGTHYYETDLIGVTAQRGVDPLDVLAHTAENAGTDQISGGEGVDALFGQDEPDYVTGNGDDDYMQGNGDGDFLWGDQFLSDADGYDPPEVFNASFPVVAIAPVTNQVVADALTPEAVLSPDAELFGPSAADGQDDQIGGWSDPGLRDGGDMVFGDGAQDFQLGDNGTLTRTVIPGDPNDDYRRFDDYRPETFHRVAERYDVGDDDATGTSEDDPTSGDDWIQGDDEDDYQWGQDGDDVLFGDDYLDLGDVGNDDMLGELDDDTMFGGPAEDVMLGDRGSIDDTALGAGVNVVADTQGPMFLHYEGLLQNQLDRRVNLLFEYPSTPEEEPVALAFDGVHHGGRDFMRGGPGHDSMHGGFADDWMNGDDDADWLFGDYGADAMWGGCGQASDPVAGCPDDPNAPVHDAGEVPDVLFNSHVDILLGGYGADILDFRPRGEGPPGTVPPGANEHPDEAVWREITGLDDADPANNQDHQGVDWIYGGWDRDVLQGDTGKNGPDSGDRLMDWTGAYNLYTRCNASYGDDGDVRQRSPMIENAIWTIAYGSGVGSSLADVTTPGSSAFEELGFVYKKDNQQNSGSAHDGTPGHFFGIECGDGGG